MSIQGAVHNASLLPAQQDDALFTLKQELRGDSRANGFAIAKVGLPNLILPSSLDIKLTNYNHYSSYVQLADTLFPGLANSQHSVIIFRPLVVKNGLHDFFVQILRLNDFVILKRKVRMLTRAEVAFMAEQEGITDDKCEMYYNIMMESDSEVVAVTKLGAVSDLKSLTDGAAPFGRRRLAQQNEDTSHVRTNVDSINGMFEVTPFSSFGEFLDLEDFILASSSLDKYKRLKGDQKTNRIND
jgi:hypothetical protein